MDSHGMDRPTGVGAVKGRIIRAAVDLFARKGYGGTAVREIAEAAGISKPTVYYYFGSKDGLGHAIADEAMAIMRSAVERATARAKTSREKLVAFAAAQFGACKVHESLARFVFSLTFAPSETEVSFSFTELHFESKRMLDGILAEAVEEGVVRPGVTEIAARIFLGIINIHVQAFLSLSQPLDATDAEKAVTCFLEGVGVR